MMIIGNPKNIFSLEGKTALVTSGRQGLGGAIAERFAQFGVDISVVDINPDTANEVVETVKAMGRKTSGSIINIASIAGQVGIKNRECKLLRQQDATAGG